ncbi:hypothetical protein SAMN05446934_6529 [Paraburkholderia hospita]|nr:hypothetical protein SAMN05446934_6529 [Paraburkholderia hospita]
MKISTVDADLVKDTFSVHGVNMRGRTVLRKVLKRRHAVEFFANLSPVSSGWGPAQASTTVPTRYRPSVTRRN